ncbi:hypothetical protein EW026_g3372 [Hermanssonia centrifuga]|uniref:Uncharacterized protein n=1 Tax=Hermanssonia centrifuga TaxID=98765 RepID=A0A4S4KLD8_9APHY|nr:hypothetical protein EW026_g3372 [Hermanssonia centrifuga]
MGDCLTRWHMSQHGYDHRFFVRVMPGKAVGTFTEMWAWWTIAVAKLVVGILTIFAWRIFAKFLLHRILPPTFRFLAQLVTLPHRRYYTPATDYTNVPQDKGLRAIPSVLDLPGMFELEMDGVSTARAVDPLTARRRDIKLRNGGGRGVGKSEKFADGFAQEGLGLGIEEMGGKEADVVKHYDADVLTKVVVYCGIGMLASGGMPIFFEVIGWGMRAN